MNFSLLDRASGTNGHEILRSTVVSQLLSSLHHAYDVKFNGSTSDEDVDVCAHRAGVNSLAIDKFEGR